MATEKKRKRKRNFRFKWKRVRKGQPRPSQADSPIVENLLHYAGMKEEGKALPFFHQGHRSHFFPDELRQVVGDGTLAMDCSITGEDNIFHSKKCIKVAQELAAELYGAAHTRYLLNGSTIGILAMVMAAVQPGDALLLPRNVHRSILSALILSGARPIYIMPQWHPACGALSISPDDVRQAFKQHSEIRAVLLTRPTYYGLARDIKDIAQLCHDNNCPLLIDEAHGAHLPFLPPGHVSPALDLSADVVVQSTHKTLCSLTGTSWLHVGHDSLVDIERIQFMLNLIQTTSPNNILLASLDAARKMMWEKGHELFAETVKRAESLRAQIDEIPGLKTLQVSQIPALAAYQSDPLKIVINVARLGLTGIGLFEDLYFLHGFIAELSDAQNMVLLLTPQDSEESYRKLVKVLQFVSSKRTAHIVHTIEQNESPFNDMPPPTLALLPREAAFSQKIKVPFEEAENRISGETIAPFPPGIPILCPGEIITKEIIEYALAVRDQNAMIHANDPTLESVVVVNK